METLGIELPPQLASDLHRLIERGWFQSEQEVIRFALTEFIDRHRFALIERFQQEDIEWAVAQKPDQGQP